MIRQGIFNFLDFSSLFVYFGKSKILGSRGCFYKFLRNFSQDFPKFSTCVFAFYSRKKKESGCPNVCKQNKVVQGEQRNPFFRESSTKALFSLFPVVHPKGIRFFFCGHLFFFFFSRLWVELRLLSGCGLFPCGFTCPTCGCRSFKLFMNREFSLLLFRFFLPRFFWNFRFFWNDFLF